MQHSKLLPGDALLIVDVQNDFIPGGALAVPEGNEVIPILNTWIDASRAAGIPIFASRDWHPHNHCSFKPEGGLWPPHCIQNTNGAAFSQDLELDDDVLIISKADSVEKDAYSAFDDTPLAEHLEASHVRRLWMGGLALDYCVLASALDALKEGLDVHIVLPATRSISKQTGKDALHTLREAGAKIEDDASPLAS